jgi:hypothetical protein
VGVKTTSIALEFSDMKAHSANTIAVVALSLMVAGCAGDGTSSFLPGSMTTGSVDQSAATPVASKSNPTCLTLASQIDALNKEGIPDKVSKAAAKKYKLKGTDITKADELNKANNEFQAKCSDYPPAPTVAAVIPPEKPAATAATATKPAKVAKAKPPVPAQKPVAQAIAPENTSAGAAGAVPAGSVSSGAVAETAAAPSAAPSGY